MYYAFYFIKQSLNSPFLEKVCLVMQVNTSSEVSVLSEFGFDTPMGSRLIDKEMKLIVALNLVVRITVRAL